MPRVLISDKMDPRAEAVFRENGVEVDYKPGLDADALRSILPQYDGLAVRSTTKVTADLLTAANDLKVIGRAGIGVDTIDVPAATARGVVVMNTPFGNSITTAEHALAMMFALARQLPQANSSTHAGKWEKNAFMGVELYGKTLGIVGCGTIGSIVANRALGLQMKVIAFDPFLTPERAREMGVEAVSLNDLFKRADFITLHTPLTDSTRNLINRDAFAQMKKGVRIINCARGGLIVESDLLDALNAGIVAGAALDVFEEEPAKTNILFGHAGVICTPHLGASTAEAQVNVAIQVAEQMSAFLLHGAVANAVNMPSISAEEAPTLKPYMTLATHLGSLIGQLMRSGPKKITLDYQGRAAALNTKPLSACAIAAIMRSLSDTVNMVNAIDMARGRGVSITESTTEQCDAYRTAIRIILEDQDGTRSVTGTLFAGSGPRIVEIDGVPIEAAITPHMLFIRNNDQPGLIGGVGTILGKAAINIADFRLGRLAQGRDAVSLIALDQALPDAVFAEIRALAAVQTAQRLQF